MPADMNSYRAQVLDATLAAGPHPEEDFFRLQVRGREQSVWINVSPEQLARIVAVFEESR